MPASIRPTSPSAPFDLTGHVALVTGGNGGIGLGMAKGLAGAGCERHRGFRRSDASYGAVVVAYMTTSVPFQVNAIGTTLGVPSLATYAIQTLQHEWAYAVAYPLELAPPPRTSALAQVRQRCPTTRQPHQQGPGSAGSAEKRAWDRQLAP